MNKFIAAAVLSLLAGYGAAHAQSGGSATSNGTSNAGMTPSSGVQTNGMSGGQTMSAPETLPSTAVDVKTVTRHKKVKKPVAGAKIPAVTDTSGDGKAGY